MTEILFGTDGTPFIRARRNLIIITAISFIHLSGALHLKNGINLVGLGVKPISALQLESCLFLFLVYFLWRFHASLNGNNPVKGVLHLINKDLEHDAYLIAHDHYRKTYPHIYGIRLLLSTKGISAMKIGKWLIKVPIINADLYDTEKKTFTFVLSRKQVKSLCFQYLRTHMFKYNYFSETLWPYIISLITLAWLSHQLWITFSVSGTCRIDLNTFPSFQNHIPF